jgi:hypothetical protein
VEWTQDVVHENYVGAPADGSAWEEGGDGARVLRGGSWLYNPRYLRSAVRNGFLRCWQMILLASAWPASLHGISRPLKVRIPYERLATMP